MAGFTIHFDAMASQTGIIAPASIVWTLVQVVRHKVLPPLSLWLSEWQGQALNCPAILPAHLRRLWFVSCHRLVRLCWQKGKIAFCTSRWDFLCPHVGFLTAACARSAPLPPVPAFGLLILRGRFCHRELRALFSLISDSNG